MKYKNEKDITCPHCNYKEKKSHMYAQLYGEDVNVKHTCFNCGEEFWLEVKTINVYDSYPLNCEEKGIEHDYKVEDLRVKTYKYDDGKYIDVPESEYLYAKMLECSVCGDTKAVQITREEYSKLKEQLKWEKK